MNNKLRKIYITNCKNLKRDQFENVLFHLKIIALIACIMSNVHKNIHENFFNGLLV